MPTCSPLGAKGCELTRAALGNRFAFVSALARRPVSIERVLRLYDLLHSTPNPIALAELALEERSLASALNEYVRAAQGS
jgi:hypothetical protein